MSRQMYAFYHGERILTQVIAETEIEANTKAREGANISCDRPNETPYEFLRKLASAKIKTYPLNSDK